MPISKVSEAGLSSNAQFNGFKNRIINGDMGIWQRGTSFTGNFTGQYGADRWSQGQYQTGPQSRQTVATAGVEFNYACRISSSSVASVGIGSRMALGQMVESLNCYDLRSTPVTLSFWVRFSNSTFTSSTATPFLDFGAQIWQYTTTTNGNFSTTTPDVVSSLSITNGALPTVWTKYSLTVTTSASLNNIAVRFNFGGLGNTAADGTLWYEITGVQLEKGSTATSFDYRPYTTELQLCQRYFETYGGSHVFEPIASGYAFSTTEGVVPLIFNTVKRAAPTLTVSSATHWAVINSAGSNLALTALIINSSGTNVTSKTVSLRWTVASGMVAGNGTVLVANNSTSARIDFSAEL